MMEEVFATAGGDAEQAWCRVKGALKKTA